MIDLTLVLAFVAYSLWVGLRSRKEASRGLEDYFLAGRTLTAWKSGFSMTATQYAADTPLLAAGLVATGGVFALWRLWIYGIAFLLLGFLLARCWWRAGVVTDAELCEIRYDGSSAIVLRAAKAVYYGLIFNCTVLAMVLAAAVRIAEPFLLWQDWLPGSVFEPIVRGAQFVGVPLTIYADSPDVWAHTASNVISVVAIFLFTMTYSAMGGLRGVVATDVMQLAVMTVGTAAYAWFAVQRVGGFSALPGALARVVGSERAAELLSFDLSSAGTASAELIAVLGLQWLLQMNSDGTGYLAQRCMGCRSEKEAGRAPIIFAFAQVLGRSLVWLPIFVALLVIYPLEANPSPAAREFTFVRGMNDLLPTGFRGLMLVGLLAALASTLDTHLNWGASYLSNDLYGRILCRGILKREPSPRTLVWVARLSSPMLVVLSLFLMSQLGSIQTAWKVTLLLGAGLGVPLLLRWLWSRMNAWGEMTAIVASGLAAPALLAWVDREPVRLLLAGSVGATSAVLGSLATAPVSPERLAAFYDRVQPPGFWGHAEARRRLFRGSLQLVAAAGSLFLSLIGLGSLLVGGTPPTFFPYPHSWPWVALIVAILLIPLWWRRAAPR